MADPNPNQIIVQLAATRQAAQVTSDAANAIMAAELGELLPNAEVVHTCAETVQKAQTIIQQCDKHIVAAILSQNNADKWLASLGALTNQMADQAKDLKSDVDQLTTLKNVVGAVAGMLSMLGV